MKKYLVVFFFIACNTAPIKENKKDSTVAESITPVPISGCYIMRHNKDSAAMQITTNTNSVTGNLSYNLFEKDKNNGTIKGIINDSLLIADYTFQAEGMTSVREVVFKIIGNELYEGYGAVTENSNKVSFKDISQLQFQPFAFTKTDCK